MEQSPALAVKQYLYCGSKPTGFRENEGANAPDQFTETI
jgi:hypothetical protein